MKTNDVIENQAKEITRLRGEIEQLKKERDDVFRDIEIQNKELGELQACCHIRGKRMEMMRKWMTGFVGSTCWTGNTIWDNFNDYNRESVNWFNETGEAR